jgi:CheY-like chemotaxis protein
MVLRLLSFAGMEAQYETKPSLLIVDDDPIQRDIALTIADRSRLFSSIDCEGSAEEALDRLLAHPEPPADLGAPKIILSDLRLPGRTGLEFARELERHECTKGLAIALYTACDIPDLRASALSAGCRAVYEKPSSIDELLSIFSDLVTKCRAA